MTNQALDPEYKDLSNFVSNAVHQARRSFERPPDTHYDRGTWHWGGVAQRYAILCTRPSQSLSSPGMA